MKTFLTHTFTALLLSASAFAGDDRTLDSCPPAVREAILRHLDGGRLDEIEAHHRNGGTVYVAEVHPAGRDHDDDDDLKIHVSGEGRILKTREDISMRQAPDSVRQALRSFGGEVEDLEKQVADGVTTFHAEIDREDRHDLRVVISPDGKVLRETPDDDGDDDGLGDD